jgi:transposase
MDAPAVVDPGPEELAARYEALLEREKTLLAERDALLTRLAQSDSVNAELNAALSNSQRLNELLRLKIDEIMAKRYGQAAGGFDASQLLLFAQQAAAAVEADAADAKATADEPNGDAGRAKKTQNTDKARHGRKAIAGSIRRERIEHPVAPAEVPCPCCGKDRVKLADEVSEQLEYIPASFVVYQHVRPKLVCRQCEGNIVVAPPPPAPIDKGLPGPGLIAHIITCKYDDHLPLHRLEHIFERHGVGIARSTMCGWIERAADLLEPLYKRMHELVLLSAVIHTDDTSVPVRDENSEKYRSGRLWVYIGDGRHPLTVFDYTPTHEAVGPAAWLAGFVGYLQADALKGYDRLYVDGSILEVGCWAHVRRKFHDAGTAQPALSLEAKAMLRRLYDVEDDAKQLDDEGRRKLRQERALPILTEIRAWLERASLTTLPKSPIGQAVSYALGNWKSLVRYCEDGRLAIDNNASERALKRVALGRSNWLFAGSDAGGRRAAILYSLVATCRRHGIDPEAYLRSVLLQVGTTPMSRIDELLPNRWKTT